MHELNTIESFYNKQEQISELEDKYFKLTQNKQKMKVYEIYEVSLSEQNFML